jgi:hypothetical protein
MLALLYNINSILYMLAFISHSYIIYRIGEKMPARQKYPPGKRVLLVYISEDLYARIRELASQDEKLHGALSRLVEELLRRGLSQVEGGGGETPPVSTHTAHKLHTRRFTARGIMPYNIVHDAFNTVMSYIKRVRNYPENEVICEITASELIRAIQATLGIDQRTIDKYLEAFQGHKLIMPSGGNVFRVKHSACEE